MKRACCVCAANMTSTRDGSKKPLTSARSAYFESQDTWNASSCSPGCCGVRGVKDTKGCCCLLLIRRMAAASRRTCDRPILAAASSVEAAVSTQKGICMPSVSCPPFGENWNPYPHPHPHPHPHPPPTLHNGTRRRCPCLRPCPRPCPALGLALKFTDKKYRNKLVTAEL